MANENSSPAGIVPRTPDRARCSPYRLGAVSAGDKDARKDVTALACAISCATRRTVLRCFCRLPSARSRPPMNRAGASPRSPSAAAIVDVTYTKRSDGRVITLPSGNFFELERGLITEIRCFFDTIDWVTLRIAPERQRERSPFLVRP